MMTPDQKRTDIRHAMTTDTNFGQRIRVAMAAANINGIAVANVLGVSPQAVSKWAKGKAYPSSKHLVEFCKLTGCSLDWVMEPSPVDLRTAPSLEQAE